MCVFVVLGGLFRDFGESARLRDGDQLPVTDERHALIKMEESAMAGKEGYEEGAAEDEEARTHSFVSAQMRSRFSR